MLELLRALPEDETAAGPLLPPIEPMQEVWACGVTYLRSRDAREAESQVGDIYTKVYNAERPEIFLKAIGWRVVGHGMPINIRRDSGWNVPEPEMTLVVNRQREIVGYCAGNDVSSRDIEGANPLYLPQAKIYNRSCALGPGIYLVEPVELEKVTIRLEIRRGGTVTFKGETGTSQMKRRPDELVGYLAAELDFPQGVFLMTGTGVVPPDEFTLQAGDLVHIEVGSLVLENEVKDSV
jgi:2-dehydro-3-deoxy-D-arabinonate dehydratase